MENIYLFDLRHRIWHRYSVPLFNRIVTCMV